MNELVLFKQLPPLSQFFKLRVQHLRERLYNLKAADVDTEEAFNKVRDFIKEAILPRPIVFEDAIFNGGASTSEASTAQKWSKRLRNVATYRVSLPFTGCTELFSYAAQSLSMPADAVIIMPSSGYLHVKLNTIFFSRYDALYAAKDLLRPTLQLICNNNEELLTWTAKMTQRIEHSLQTFRKECNDLYYANDLLRHIGDV